MTSAARHVALAAGLLFLAACQPGSGPPDSVPTSSTSSVSETAARVDVPPVVARVPVPEAGRIEGHVRLDGKAPGNRVIRMTMDPGCAAATDGRMVVDEQVAATADGSLGNVFVYLEGDLPRYEPHTQPVRISQRDCMYEPRVVGAELGQPIEIANDEPIAHNVHGWSGEGNGFNVGQPREGMVHRFVPEVPEIMLHVACDVHRWMHTYIGIVPHSFFATTRSDGDFVIDTVPAGTYTIHSWHEVYGDRTETVEVMPGGVATIEIAYRAE